MAAPSAGSWPCSAGVCVITFFLAYQPGLFHSVFPGWADTTAPGRVEAGPRLNALLEVHLEEPSVVVVCENGMALAEA